MLGFMNEEAFQHTLSSGYVTFFSRTRNQLWTKGESLEKKVHVLPKHLDEKVARLHLDKLGVKLTKLSPEQAAYIGVPVDGPYKPEHYRY